jgi:hypothetical protein
MKIVYEQGIVPLNWLSETSMSINPFEMFGKEPTK